VFGLFNKLKSSRVVYKETLEGTNKRIFDAMQAHRAYRDVSISLSQDISIKIEHSDGGIHTINPDNTHDRILQTDDEAERVEIISDFVEINTQIVFSKQERTLSEATIDRLLPIVRAQLDIEDESTAIVRQLTSDIYLYLIVDTDYGVHFVPYSELEDFEMGEQELWEKAYSNLSAKLNGKIEIHDNDEYNMILFDGFYESSVLLETAFWRHIEKDMDGFPVAAVRARDLCLFADSGKPDSIQQLQDAVNDEKQLSHAISRTLLKFTDGVWSEYRTLN
jgi:hypothetical protein